MRTLIRFIAAGIALLTLTAMFGTLAIHLYGSHRLATEWASFDDRWGHLIVSAPSPSVPEHENAARWLVVGGQAIVCSLEDQKFFGGLADRPAATWSESELLRAKRILQEQQPALDLLIRSGSHESFHLGRNGSKANHEEIDFLSIVKGCRLLIVDARLAWFDGRRADALNALKSVGRAADGLMETPMVMASTMGSAAARWFVWAAADFVGDPCIDPTTLNELRAALPSGDPVHANDITMAASVAEIADERMAYIEEFYDPSVGWSVPFWIPNRFLFEDLVIANLIHRWERFLELGSLPAAEWPSDVAHSIWRDTAWPRWLVMTGAMTPDLLSARARAQAASTELQQLRLAFDLRLASPSGLDPNACELAADASPSALTGEAMTCRNDKDRGTIVIETPGAERALKRHSAAGNRASLVPPLELTIRCRRDTQPD